MVSWDGYSERTNTHRFRGPVHPPLPLLVNSNAISKAFGVTPLFKNVSFSIHDGDRLGIIGPNGSGKSTLLKILAGTETPDSGEVVLRSKARVAYVPQDSVFAPGRTVTQVIESALEQAAIPEADQPGRLAETLGRAGFEDFFAEAAALSGGWRKRLAIAEALVQHPALLLLDEPTNHLDLAGIAWLEGLLGAAKFAVVVISHDRYFLENVPTSMAELSRAYPDGMLRVDGNYSAFLEKKAEFLHAQARRQESLENRVRTEMEWLRRGPKARATKAKARIDQAYEMIGELADLKDRARTGTADIDFAATGRKTKRLVHLEAVAFGYPGEPRLFEDLTYTITSGMRVGLVGPNGSGKTTLLKLLSEELEPTEGTIQRAPQLRIVAFSQIRELNDDQTLRDALAPDGDSVIYQDRVVHVATWAARFLFTKEQLHQPVSRLSGGERARVLIANLMREPADLLLLDEPTNDLDIPTLEILEESLLEFPGAMVLVTHDRYLLDRVSSIVLGFDGHGNVGRFADYSQWDLWQSAQKSEAKSAAKSDAAREAPAQETPAQEAPTKKKKLSYMENREYEAMEAKIADAEAELAAKQAAVQDPDIVTDPARVESAYREMEAAQKLVDDLYARWAELEEKLA